MDKNFKAQYQKITDAASLQLGDVSRLTFLPGFCDVHVHFREPGFSYKETIASGSKAAARGGYVAVCTMPNLNPVPDSPQNLRVQTDIVNRDACIAVYPYGAITIGQNGKELVDMSKMPNAIAFSDDGKGVQSEEIMLAAMQQAAFLGKIIAAHCEDNSLLLGGYIHDGEYAKTHGHKGISSASEYKQIERDLILAEKTKCKYHVCHISAKESVQLVRDAKKSGVDVTCETAPHYLVLTQNDLIEDGRFKMNPPLRNESDRDALIEGVIDGTIDMIATDHAPHSLEEKSKGLSGSSFGIVGLETAFPLLYTHLVKKGIITLDKLVDLMSTNPKKRFNISSEGFSGWDLNEEFIVNPNEFLSKGRATPLAGAKLFGVNKLTVYQGAPVYVTNEINK